MEIAIQRILAPIDFSDNASTALEFAQGIARKFDAEIRLVHVVEASPYEVYQQRGFLQDVPLYERAGASPPRTDQRFVIHDVLEETRNQLEALAKRGEGLKITANVRHGHVVDELLQEIDEYQPQLVVTCTHGWTGIKHLVMGSVTEKLVRMSPVPVLTVRGTS